MADDESRQRVLELRAEVGRLRGKVVELLAEIGRLRSMIRYALDGPDDAWRKILTDALNGKDGA